MNKREDICIMIIADNREDQVTFTTLEVISLKINGFRDEFLNAFMYYFSSWFRVTNDEQK